jgi:Vault protein inter-alpha-trypsin domain
MSEQNHGSQTQNPGLRSEQKHGSQTQNPGQRSEQNHGSQTQNPAQSRDRSQVHTRKKGYLRRGEKRQHLFTRPISLASLEEKAGGKHGTLFLFFGVILPVIAVAFELTTHFCAQHFFDPFPSSNHVILFLLIPLSNFMAWLAGRRDMSAHFGFMSLISGMAMGIGCLYALMFLPLTPHAALWTLVFGFGLLGFAPLLSVPCTWLSGKTVCKLAASRKTFFDAHQVEHIGHLIVLCLVVAVELPSTLTRMNLSLAADPATEKQGVQWLRQFGSEEVMLRACYERSGRATDILGSLYEAAHPVSIESARTIFYEVTGKPFNSVPIPAAARATIQHAGLVDDPNGLNADVKDEFDLDSDIAGENVSGVARGLAVSKTEVRGTVDSDAAVAELDWNTTFTNSSPYDREARAKLLLPPGGVVTKASVTINGVEHDATILVRSLARAIYRQAVAERRKDPLLVSTCGIRCSPMLRL